MLINQGVVATDLAASQRGGAMYGKVLVGYQGWFNAEGDGMGLGYRHYQAGGRFEPGACSVDAWPDLSEFDGDLKYPTPFRHADGACAYVFSSSDYKTVDKHFQWMSEYGIDGALLQRFGSDIRLVHCKPACDKVLENVRGAAEAHGREYALMYDLSGMRAGEIEGCIRPDFRAMLDAALFDDASYLRHKGRPVIAVWGIGFNDKRQYSLRECADLIRHIKSIGAYGGFTVVVGVPYHWRTLRIDAVSDPMLHQIIRLADVILPWSVGRYRTTAQADALPEKVLTPDIRWADSHGLDYMPVIFPGFSWRNLQAGLGQKADFEDIPRLGGRFLWAQALAAHRSGAKMIYIAMFDELDEATAIMKLCPDPPVGASPFLRDGEKPPDHYLRLAGRVKGLLNGKLGPTHVRSLT